jgi:hypothetical protein
MEEKARQLRDKVATLLEAAHPETGNGVDPSSPLFKVNVTSQSEISWVAISSTYFPIWVFRCSGTEGYRSVECGAEFIYPCDDHSIGRLFAGILHRTHYFTMGRPAVPGLLYSLHGLSGFGILKAQDDPASQLGGDYLCNTNYDIDVNNSRVPLISILSQKLGCLI